MKTKPGKRKNAPQPLQISDSVRQKREDQRMANLAMELGLAGAQVLQEQFSFTQEQTKQWFDQMIARARQNRQGSGQAVLAAWAEQARQGDG